VTPRMDSWRAGCGESRTSGSAGGPGKRAWPKDRHRAPGRPNVVLTTTRSRAEEARRRIEAVLAELGLRLHPDKTRIVYLGGGADGFDFLGFHHRKTPSKYGDRRYLSKWPSARAMASIRAKVRAHTDRRFASRDLRDVVAGLNPVLRGWGAYFRYETRTGSSPPWTATCTSGCPSWPASSTPPEDASGSAGSTTAG
jgi:hypothetical protein